MRQRFIENVVLPVLNTLDDDSPSMRLNNLSTKACATKITIYEQDWAQVAPKLSSVASAEFVDAEEILYYRGEHGSVKPLQNCNNTSRIIADPKLIIYYQLHFGCTLSAENGKRVACFNEIAAKLFETGNKKFILSYPQFGKDIGNFCGYTSVKSNWLYIQGYYQIYHNLTNLYLPMSGPTVELLFQTPDERIKSTVSE